MLTALAVMAVLALATAAMAQYPGPDSIGIYTATDGSFVETSMSTSAAFEQVDVYVCITNTSATSLGGWEAAIVYDGFSFQSITETAGVNGNQITDPNTFNEYVGIGTGANALNPNGAGVYHVATISGLVASTDTVVELFIRAYPIPSIPSWDGPVYSSGIDAGDLRALYPSTGGPNVPVFRINGDGPMAPKATSWGGVKSLF